MNIWIVIVALLAPVHISFWWTIGRRLGDDTYNWIKPRLSRTSVKVTYVEPETISQADYLQALLWACYWKSMTPK